MEIFNNGKKKIELVSENNFYENSKDYEYEKKYDKCQYILKYNYVAVQFFPKYQNIIDDYNEYLSSRIFRYSDKLKHGEYSNFKDFVNKNSIKVQIVITKKDKQKTYSETKYADIVYTLINTYERAKNYKTNLNDFLKTTMGNKKTLDEESVILLEMTSRLIINTLENSKIDDKLVTNCKNFVDYIVDQTSYSNDSIYGINHCTISNLPVLTQIEKEKINNFNSYLEEKLEKQNNLELI